MSAALRQTPAPRAVFLRALEDLARDTEARAEALAAQLARNPGFEAWGQLALKCDDLKAQAKAARWALGQFGGGAA